MKQEIGHEQYTKPRLPSGIPTLSEVNFALPMQNLEQNPLTYLHTQLNDAQKRAQMGDKTLEVLSKTLTTLTTKGKESETISYLSGFLFMHDVLYVSATDTALHFITGSSRNRFLVDKLFIDPHPFDCEQPILKGYLQDAESIYENTGGKKNNSHAFMQGVKDVYLLARLTDPRDEYRMQQEFKYIEKNLK
ncbi:MAG: hypothetical protein KBC00_01170 [Candidatus Levybacteria bacterium]|nr:hypothetical protein [Candidatus Levybacteria bacterium]MBP9814947.1 hypothetical protein [Candidatus Levybacteria bacterium]